MPSHDELSTYVATPKFADPAAWLKRGLNPSSPEVQARMELFVNTVALSVLAARQRNASSAETRRAVLEPLRAVKAAAFDTEEREWLCAEVAKVAKLAGVSVNHELNEWLYGKLLGAWLRLWSPFDREPKTLATYSTRCESCSAVLSAEVTAKSPAIPDSGWFVCSCNKCGCLNLLRLGPEIKGTRSVGFKFIRHLRFEEYTQEKANAVLFTMRQTAHHAP
jgi:hypothetical protein